MLGAIQLAVVANKFNLPLNKCWNRCARGQPVFGSSFLYDQDKTFKVNTTSNVI